MKQGRDSSVSIENRYGLDGPEIESRWWRDFPHMYRWPWGQPSPLYSRYRVFLRSKAAWAWPWPPIPI